MNLIIESKQPTNEICWICRENFYPGESKVNHEGAQHPPFHGKCLVSPVCPIEGKPLNLPIRERILQRLSSAIANAIYATIFQLATIAVGAAARKGAAAAVEMATVHLRIQDVATIAMIAATAAYVTRKEEAGMGVGRVVGITGIFVAIITSIAVTAAEMEVDKIVIIAGAIILGMAIAGAGAGGDRILDRLDVHPISRENIGLGIFAGLLAATTEISSIPNTALISGTTAGILSMIRK